MRALKHIAFFLFCIITLCSCSKKLLPPTVEAKESIRNYKYAYVTGTDPLVTGSGTMVSGIYLSSQSSANPKDIITGRLVKEGFVILPELKEELLEETIIVNYGQGGCRKLSLFYVSTEIVLQFLSTKTNQIICNCASEGCGEHITDDIQIAINRAFDAMLGKGEIKYYRN